MNILGIDYGRRKVGLSRAIGPLAEPLSVVHFKKTDEMFAKLTKVISDGKYEKVIVGVSEGNMAIEIKNFIEALKKLISAPVEEFDETLTSADAFKLSLEAGIRRKKRVEMEDAYAAAIMLQGYLDNI